nr:retrovirus-related Pol polyprotein from transposon 17.6 [Tanacetum cinerariifolium]
MVTKLKNEITKFEQKSYESLFEAWEHYKLSIDRCPNHNMIFVTQIDMFYNGLTLSHETPSMLQREELYAKDTGRMLRIDREYDRSPKPLGHYTAGGYTQETAYATTVILKKLPKKLGDPDKFLNLYDFSELVECLALADLGASINLIPLSIWKKFSLPEVTPTTERALIDVYGEELTLRVDDEAITFKVGQTSKYSYNDVESTNQIDVIDVACEEYVQEIPIDPQDQEKTTFTCPYGTFAYRRMPFGLCNAPCTFQRCMMAIFHDMIEEMMEVFMDDFSVFGDSFSSYLSHFDQMLKRAKVDVKAKLPHLTSVKVGAVLGKRKTKHFQPIHYASKTMTEAQAHYTTTEKELLAVVYTFKKFRPYLVLSKTIVYTDHLALRYLLAKQDAKPRLLWWILLLHKFDVIIRDKKRAKNLVADHLSRLKIPHQDELKKKEITKIFPLETLGIILFRGDSSTTWFADIANYHAGKFIVKGISSQ